MNHLAYQRDWLHRLAAEALRDLAQIEHEIAAGVDGDWDRRTPRFLTLLAQGRGACRQLEHIAQLLADIESATREVAPIRFEAWRAAQFERIAPRQKPLYGIEVDRAA